MKSLKIVFLLAIFVSLRAQAQAQASRSYDVYDSVGVNTHWYYGGSGENYQYLVQFPALIQLMQQARIYHFRDGEFAQGYNTPAWITSMYSQLAASGMKADLIVASGQSLSQLESGLQAYPGLEAIESPNEWDLNGGSNWPSTMLTQLPILWQAGQDLRLTVLGPSLTQSSSFARLGDVAHYMNYDNMHPYTGGRNPETTGWGGGVDAQGNGYGSIAWNLDMVHEYGPGLAAYATETGYQTTATPTAGQVPETVAGTYAPRLIMEMFKHGVKRTYLYELIDDPTWAQPGYGLLRHDMSPKPSYTALSNLQSILQDDDTQFTPQSLNYSLAGNMSGVETLLLQKTDGTFYLAVWLDGSIYDITALKATPINPQQLTLTLPQGDVVSDVDSFNPDGTVTASSPHLSTYSVDANSCLTLIHIGVPLTPAASPTFSPTSGTYASPQSVAITDGTPGAQIYFTTDGSTPTTSSNLYAGAIAVNSSETIQAIAAAPGYGASAVSSAAFTISLPPDFSVSASPGALTIPSGQSATLALTITPLNGFSSAIAFSCSGLPANASCAFSPATVTPSGAAVSTATLTVATTPSGVAAKHRDLFPILPESALAGLLCLIGGKKRARIWLALLILSLAGMSALSGCAHVASPILSNRNISSTSTVTVTATAGPLRHTATFSLVVQ